ncbi:MAG: MCE family protein [Myxococcales bacterium]|nr:MCE family protein [Myxococcales bacterium]
MKGVTAVVKVGILFIVMVVGSYGVFKTVSEQPSGESEFEVWARLDDAAGLPAGSQVVVAGLPVGQVSELRIDGRFARVTVRMRDDVTIWGNAVLFKKSSSLLGNFYLEIDPGSPESISALGQVTPSRQLPSGSEIVRVVEATSVDMLLRRLDESMPKVDAVLLSVRDLSEDVRGVVNGPLASVMSRVDNLVQDESATVSNILERTDRTLARIEDITRDIRGVTSDANVRVKTILDNLDKASLEARGLLEVAKAEVEQTGDSLRSRIESFDEVVEPTASVMRKIDEEDGTLGRLVNDSTIADNVEDITDDAKGFLGTLFGMQTYVGLRSEISALSGLSRHYISIDLQTRPDKFYSIELSKGPRGNYPVIAVNYDSTTDSWQRTVRIEDTVRFTFQFAKRYDWLTVRYGLKDSSGGVGLDAAWFDNRLKLSADLFSFGFADAPRLKLAAAYEFFGGLYVLAGIDDALNPGDVIVPGAFADPTTPELFDTIPIGLDYFFGAMLRFNDADLAALMTVGGSALAGAAD